jgi:hypothetical protein
MSPFELSAAGGPPASVPRSDSSPWSPSAVVASPTPRRSDRHSQDHYTNQRPEEASGRGDRPLWFVAFVGDAMVCTTYGYVSEPER